MHRIMKIHKLFIECLAIDYSHSGEGVDFALKIDRDSLYIYFQDSEGLEDWRVNINFPAKAYKREGRGEFYAHRGFLNSWESVKEKLEKHILDNKIGKITVVGYSHGAAIAALCHEHVWYVRPDLRDTLEGYGFGAPRVIWGAVSEKIKSRWANFTVIRNIDDAVTHLPPAFLGYLHVGKMIEIGKKGKYGKIEAHLPENIEKELVLYEQGNRENRA